MDRFSEYRIMWILVLFDLPTETKKDNQQESQAVKTGDQAPITMMSVLGMISLFMFVVLQKKYEA
mgnify:CR=1 FL=1